MMLNRSPTPAFRPWMRSVCEKRSMSSLSKHFRVTWTDTTTLSLRLFMTKVQSASSSVGMAYCQSSTGQVRSIFMVVPPSIGVQKGYMVQRTSEVDSTHSFSAPFSNTSCNT